MGEHSVTGTFMAWSRHVNPRPFLDGIAVAVAEHSTADQMVPR